MADDPAPQSQAEANGETANPSIQRPKPRRPKLSGLFSPVIPTPEVARSAAAAANSGLATASAFSPRKISPESTTLSPPVTITYSGSSPTVTVNTSGSSQGIYSGISNTKNASSALYGTTNGSGAGVAGYNTGTGGPAGKFYVTNSSSAQPAVYATTNGSGSAVSGIVTNQTGACCPTPAIYGQNISTAYQGIGVEGNGNYIGVEGVGNGQEAYGVIAMGNGGVTGVGGSSDFGVGVYATLESGNELYYPGAALFAQDSSGSGAFSYAVYASSANNVAVYGTSENVSAEFHGGKNGTGTCTYTGGSGWNCSSDKNLKKNLVPVDSDALLEHLAALPMFEYSMKGDSTSARYVGPTAQDFMAAFHLGSDDKLINTANAQGVALAAAKQLYEKVKEDEEKVKQNEAEIVELKKLLAAQAAHTADMEAAFTARMATLEQQRDAGSQTVAFRR